MGGRSTMVLIGRARGVGRQVAALTGALAILVQAVLFAWHQHALPYVSRGAPVVAAAATGSATPVLADHDCPICFAVAHHGAVPVELFVPSPPNERALQQRPPATLGNLCAPYLLFRSRAPPWV